MSEITWADIDVATKAYADRRALLAGRLTALERALAVVKRQHLQDIKRQVVLTAECETALRNAIDAAPALFEKPKTRVLHGIKVGYRKGVGGLNWEDDADVVAKIEKHFKDPDEAVRYLIVKKKPSAEALDELDASTLKKFGIVVVETGEQVVVKAVESDVEKLVKLLLKDAMDDSKDAA